MLCDSPAYELYTGLEDHLFGVVGRWSMARCSNSRCGLAWLEPHPASEDIAGFYADYYTHREEAGGGRSDEGASSRTLMRSLSQLMSSALGLRRARRRSELMFLQDRAPGRLLDLGCGSGARLRAFARGGWAVEGQDVDARALAVAREQNPEGVFHHGDLTELALPPSCYDAIIMNHVLEHLENPLGVLRACKKLLKPGGDLVSIQPNLDSRGHEKFGAHWRGLELPRHLYHYSPGSMAGLVEAAGLRGAAVTTSVVNRENFYIGSQLLRHGLHRQDVANLPMGIRVGTMLSQYSGFLLHWASPKRGEELVLHWRKPRPANRLPETQ